MSRLPKEYSDRIKRGQRWKCGNPKCTYGQGGKPASIKSGGHIHHKDGDPTNDKYNNLIALCRKCHQKIPRRPKDWVDKILYG